MGRTLGPAAALVVGIAIVISWILVGSHQVGATKSPRMYRAAQLSLPLGSISTPPITGQAQALAAAEAYSSPKLFTHPYAVAYGSYDFVGSYTRPDESSGLTPVGTENVWKFTITGLDIPRPCAPGAGDEPARCPPPQTTLVIFVDDKRGTVTEMDGF